MSRARGAEAAAAAGRDLMSEINLLKPAVSRTSVLNAGFRFAHDGPGISAPPPLPGEHTEDFLRELA
jgi:CoA:oxalate CoA-transferase